MSEQSEGAGPPKQSQQGAPCIHGKPAVSVWLACRVFQEQIVSGVVQEAGSELCCELVAQGPAIQFWIHPILCLELSQDEHTRCTAIMRKQDLIWSYLFQESLPCSIIIALQHTDGACMQIISQGWDQASINDSKSLSLLPT